MELSVEGTESDWWNSRYYQLIIAEDTLTGLFLSSCPPSAWRRSADAAPGPADTGAAVARLRERYRRMGAAAALGESTPSFALDWNEVHEVRVGTARRPTVTLLSATRSWLGRKRRVFRLEPLDGREPDELLDQIELQLSGRVAVRRW